MGWLKLTLDLDPASLEGAETILEAFAPLSVTLSDAAHQPVFEPDPGTTPLWHNCRLEALFDPALDVGGLRDALSAGGFEAVDVDFLDDADWQNRWRQFAVDFCFADRLWLVPKDVPAPGEPALHLDPGLAFGSGSHPTTRLCLDWLARSDLTGKSLLDYGCGSGVLALAALKLGAGDVLAIDHDPQALLATRENATYNALDRPDSGSELSIGLPDTLGERTFDIVIANILANPLQTLADVLTAALEPSGVLVMSGVLETQADSVMNAYPELSFGPVALEADEQGTLWARLAGVRTG